MPSKSKKEKMMPCIIVSYQKRNGKWEVRETNQGEMPANLSKTKDKRFTARDVGGIKAGWSRGSFRVEDKDLGRETVYIPKKSTPKSNPTQKSRCSTKPKSTKRTSTSTKTKKRGQTASKTRSGAKKR